MGLNDVTNAILFLASEEATFLTGVQLPEMPVSPRPAPARHPVLPASHRAGLAMPETLQDLMPEAYIVGAVRIPVGTRKGALADQHRAHLAPPCSVN